MLQRIIRSWGSIMTAIVEFLIANVERPSATSYAPEPMWPASRPTMRAQKATNVEHNGFAAVLVVPKTQHPKCCFCCFGHSRILRRPKMRLCKGRPLALLPALLPASCGSIWRSRGCGGSGSYRQRESESENTFDDEGVKTSMCILRTTSTTAFMLCTRSQIA